MYSPSIDKLIAMLKKLPSVGQHTAERFVFHWLKSGKKEVAETMAAIKNLVENVKSCKICWNFSDSSPCKICLDKNRDNKVLCVVSEAQSIPVIEKTGIFKGYYHVLRGVIDASYIDEIKELKIHDLFSRLKKPDNRIQEIILALNPDLPGETTMLFLEKEIKSINPKIKTTRLARGLPMGSDLQYADEITLGSALRHRY